MVWDYLFYQTTQESGSLSPAYIPRSESNIPIGTGLTVNIGWKQKYAESTGMDELFLNSNHLKFPKILGPRNRNFKNPENQEKAFTNEASRGGVHEWSLTRILRHEQDFAEIKQKGVYSIRKTYSFDLIILNHLWIYSELSNYRHLAGGEGARFWQDGWIWDIPISRT